MSEALDLMESLAKQGVVFWGEGGLLRFRASKGALTEEIRSQLTSQKEPLLAAWRGRATQSVVSYPAAHGQRLLQCGVYGPRSFDDRFAGVAAFFSGAGGQTSVTAYYLSRRVGSSRPKSAWLHAGLF